jgi:CheY-like chemotaxis protein
MCGSSTGLQLVAHTDEPRVAGWTLPIIMVSANSADKQVLTGLEHGANDYITKPFHRDDLTNRICAHIRCSQLADAELHIRAPVAHASAAVTPLMLVRAAGPGSVCIGVAIAECSSLFAADVCAKAAQTACKQATSVIWQCLRSSGLSGGNVQ